jgi:HJR/Mrr/RecB family endonuclease
MAPRKFADLSGSAFEDMLVQLYGAMGYSVQKTGKAGDAGCDLVVNMNNERWVIQAKRYSNSVGIAAVQEANTAKPIYNCSRAMVVTTSNFTKEAYEAARANNVKLVEGDELEALLSRYLKQNWK